MGNSQATLVVPLTVDEDRRATASPAEQPRDFRFAVTWFALFAYLNPVEAAGPRPRFESPSPSLALVPVVAEPPQRRRAESRQSSEAPQRGSHDSNAAWEMVVPKMIRTGRGDFTPAESNDPAS